MLAAHAHFHVLELLWSRRIDLFWFVWLAITLVGLGLVAWLVPSRKGITASAPRPSRRIWSRQDICFLAAFSILMVVYCASLLAWEDFAYYDNSLYTLGTLAGHNIHFFIWPDLGRFFPLCNQEFNFLRHFTHSVTGYHAFRIVELALTCIIIIFFANGVRVRTSVALVLILLITPSIVISFGGLIYPEANIVLCLACLAWCVARFEETRRLRWGLAAVIAAQVFLYYKEMDFALLLGFVIGRIGLRCWAQEGRGWDLTRLRDPESRLDLCLGFLVLPFLVCYFAAMYPNYRTGYADEFRLPLGQVLSAYIEVDFVALVLVIAVAVRSVSILRRRVQPSLLWDGLALGAVCFYAGYCALRMYSAYYLAPVDCIAVLYLGHGLSRSWSKLGAWTRSIIVVVTVLVVVQDLSLSCFRIYEEKNVIHAKAELAQVIHTQFSGQKIGRLFFPFAQSVHVMEFGAYLTYREIPIEQQGPDGEANGEVLLVGKAVKKDGPCISGKPIVCHFDESPRPGDLIVMLPDDAASSSELTAYGEKNADVLFSYVPHPEIECLGPYISSLHVISPEFSRRHLPDSFLHASVSRWRGSQ